MFASDPERLARFEREAKSLAVLSHPNIAQIYGVEEIAAGGESAMRALVMELIEGEDLSARIHRGPIPVAEALEIPVRVAASAMVSGLYGPAWSVDRRAVGGV